MLQFFRKEPLEHTLLYGQPGLGKTTLAFLIAHELNTKCRIATAPAIERPRDIVGLLLGLKKVKFYLSMRYIA